MTIQEWRNYNKIRRELLDFGCIIFGGAVRDEIIHNMNAIEFYKEQTEFYLKNPTKKNVFNYSDKKISPNTIGRLLIPNDIDAFIKENKRNEIITYFTRKYNIHISKITDLSYLKQGVPEGQFTIYKIELTKKFINNYFVVKIDLITINNLDNEITINDLPLDIDFDVNSLLWSKQKGIHSKYDTPNSMHNSLMLHDIITNIQNKVAIMDNAFLWSNVNESNLKYTFIKEYRIGKLKSKGWTIKINFNIYNFYKITEFAEDDSCIICLKQPKEIKYCVNFKHCNCKPFVCLECIEKEYKKLMKCPCCKKSIMSTEHSHIYAYNEIHLFKKFICE
jgi:hypothetical protein